MPTFRGQDSHIHNIARGLLVRGDTIVLCRIRNAEWFFLPGGHIEDGESAHTALERELEEEMGNVDHSISSFIGVCEHIFPLENDVFQHELNIVFQVDVSPDRTIDSIENHITFESMSKEEFHNATVLPRPLHEGILAWQETGMPFFKGV